jgi:hypothetical protein
MRAPIALTAVALLLGGVGCSADADEPDAPPRPVAVQRLASLCDATRVEIEALGEPRDEGAAVFSPWAKIGVRFVKAVRALQVAPARREQLESLATYYEGFYDSLAQAYLIHRSGRSDGIKQTLERGYALLESGENVAVALGAPECAVRPFEAES